MQNLFCTMIFCIEKQLFWKGTFLPISLGNYTDFLGSLNFLEYLLLYSKKQIKSAGEKKEFLQNQQKRTAKWSLPHWISSFWYPLLQHGISKHFSCRENWIFKAEKKIYVFWHINDHILGHVEKKVAHCDIANIEKFLFIRKWSFIWRSFLPIIVLSHVADTLCNIFSQNLI